MSDSTPKWTDRQQEAIDDRGNSLLVSAAAGSGKTAVLVERIEKLLLVPDENGKRASLDRMLIVTFTKAAASEMKEKLRKALGEALKDKGEEEQRYLRSQLSMIGRADICTFDSFAQKLVRTYYQVINADPGFRVCDEYASSLLKAEALDEMFKDLYESEDKDFRDFLDRYSTSKSDENVRNMILNLYSYIDTLDECDAEEFLKKPMFDPAFLLGIGKKYAETTLEQMISFFKLLEELFDVHKMPERKKLMAEAVSDTESRLEALRKGYVEETVEWLCKYTFSRKLRTQAREWQDNMYIVGDMVDVLWDGGAKEVQGRFKGLFDGLSLERLESEAEMLRSSVMELCALTADFREKYKKKKEKEGLIDFSDGEHMAVKILKKEDVQKECREKYEHIFVDEYQDCNPVQEKLIECISSGNNLFTVGDVKQSIYRFRHAEPEIFIKRRKEYKAGKKDCKAIDLNSNFRSQHSVIRFVNSLFENLMTEENCGIKYDSDAALVPGRQDYSSYSYEPVLYLVDRSDDEEAEDSEVEELKKTELEALMAVKLIKKYCAPGVTTMVYDNSKHEDRKLEYRDMAILLRSARNRAEIYYEALTKAGIPAYLERDEGYFDTPEIQTAVNLLKIIDNPMQDVPLISVMYFPSFGFTSEELARIRTESRRRGEGRVSYYDAFVSMRENGEGALAEKCRSFSERIRDWRLKSRALSLSDFLWDLLRESGIMTFAAGLSSGEQRVANLNALVDRAADYERNNAGGIYGFTEYIKLISDKKSKVKTGQSGIVSSDENAVRIMTIHKSKGLEYSFVLFASAGGQPFRDKDHSRVVYRKGLGTSMYLSKPEEFSSLKSLSYSIIKEEERKAELAEEIRLFYVAATRARDMFFMCAAEKNVSKMIQNAASYRIKKERCANYAQMALPYIKVKTVTKKELIDSSDAEEASENREKLKESFEKGFEIDESKMEGLSLEELKERLSYDYTPPLSEQEKKKFSVSELAEREREKEGYVFESPEFELPVPAFLGGTRKLSAAETGTAYHKVMEHIDFSKGEKDRDSIAEFAKGLCEKGILSEEELAAIRPERIAAFFASETGRRACRAEVLKKETPFVLRHEDGGRTVLVQGTIDCWFEEDGKLYLIDYKSNYVDTRRKEDELERLKKEYRPQLDLYREALEKILGKKVEGAYLFLFSAGEWAEI